SPKDLDLAGYLPRRPARFRRQYRHVVLRPTRPLVATLSPVRMLRHLFGLHRLAALTRQEGRALADEQGDDVATLEVTVVGHFLPADLGRMFGSAFYDSLFHGCVGEQPVVLRESKLLGFMSGGGWPHAAPVVEYAQTQDGRLCQIRLSTRDTALPFGPGSLDKHCRTFLGTGKGETLGQDDKADMRQAFEKKTKDAY